MGLIHDLPTVIVATAAPGQVTFSFPFKIYAVTDIEVTVDGVVAVYNPTPGTSDEYLVAMGVDEGGTIAFGAGLVGGEEVIINSVMPLERVTQFPESGPVPMSDVNTELNRHVRLMQDIKRAGEESIKVFPGEDGITLPPEAERALKYLFFDVGGNPVYVDGVGDEGLSAALAEPTGAGGIGFSHAAVYAGGTVGDHLSQWVNITDAPYNAVGDGVTDDTAAIQAAMNAHSNLYAPVGTYLVETLDVPDIEGFKLFGAGNEQTVFVAKNDDEPIFRKALVAGVCQHGSMGDFSLKAHASGSTGPAFDCSGFRNFKFSHIMGLSNGSAGFASLFDVAAHPYLTYGVTWEHCGLAGQAGWARVWRFHNNGQGVLANANNVRIVSPWIYDNTGMTAGIDIANCTGYTIEGGLIESAGDYGVILGSRGNVFGVWFESQAIAPIQFQNTQSVFSANNLIESCYFSGFSGDIPIPNSCAANTIENCSGPYTITPATAADNNASVNAPHGGEATVVRVAGVAGTLTKISDTRMSIMDGTRKAVYTFQASGGTPSNVDFSVTPPVGFSIRHMTTDFYDAANGVPAMSIANNVLSGITAGVPNGNLYQLVILYRYQ